MLCIGVCIGLLGILISHENILCVHNSSSIGVADDAVFYECFKAGIINYYLWETTKKGPLKKF